jgi:hypothetical protein
VTSDPAGIAGGSGFTIEGANRAARCNSEDTNVHKTFLVVTIDTEEDQWGPHDGETSVSNLSSIPRLQSLFDSYGVMPTYLVSYPVASDNGSSAILRGILNSGRCEIGAHLHPWNTPPVREEATNRNSMLGNLPYELQYEKVVSITEFLTRRFGARPTSFRTGRWGLGKETIKALISCGYLVDSSVTPFISWEAYEGPSFVSAPFEPYFIDSAGKISVESKNDAILEIPATVGYSRWPFKRLRIAERILERMPSCLHAAGLASRMNIVRKIWMDPETETSRNMDLLSRVLLGRGVGALNMFFHSNSLVPGLTPFIKTETELEDFYRRLSTFFRGFLAHRDVESTTLSRVGESIREDRIEAS